MSDPDDHAHQAPDAVLPPDSPLAGPDLGGLLGGLDIGSLLGMAGDMQKHLADQQATAAATMLEGAAGGGVVKVTVSGAGEFQSVVIDPQVVDPADVEMLQDLVLAALHEAMAQVHELQESSGGGGGVAGLAGLPDLGSLGDLFGGVE